MIKSTMNISSKASIERDIKSLQKNKMKSLHNTAVNQQKSGAENVLATEKSPISMNNNDGVKQL